MKKKGLSKPHLEVTAGVIWKGERVLITRRPPGSHMEGYWEFPGGKREGGETLEQCLERELYEELGLEVEVREPIVTVNHEYEDRVVTLYSYNCHIAKGRVVAKESQEVRWVKAGDLGKYLFPPPDAEIINIILGERVSNRKSWRA